MESWKPPLASLLLLLPFFVLLIFTVFVTVKSVSLGDVVNGTELAAAPDKEEATEESMKYSSSSLEELSVPLRSLKGRNLLALPPPKSSTAVVAFLDGSIYFVDGNSGRVRGSFSSGHPLSTSYHSLTDDSDYLYCGDDWNLYEYSKEGPKKLRVTADEYVNMTPFTSVDGGFTLGSKKSTEFFFDGKTGEVVSSCWTDDSLVDEGLKSEKDKSLVPKLLTHTHSDVNEEKFGIFYIVRKDYAISHYASSRKLSWNMTVSYIEAHSCIGSNCTKISVYPVYGINPFSLGLGHLNQLQLPEGIIERELHHQPLFHLSPLALDMPSQPPYISKQGSVDVKNNASLTFSDQKVATSLSKFGGGSFMWYTILFLPFLAFLLYKVVRSSMRSDEKLTDSGKRQHAANKKRKVRKASSKNNSTVNKSNMHPFSNSDEDEADKSKGLERKNRDSLLSLLAGGQNDNGRSVGKLFIKNTEIAKGSNGTVIFEGTYDRRPVAVKRLVRAHHDIASKEIENLIASDQHPNIVRWIGVDYDSDFVYISLERCICSLNDLIEPYADSFSDTATAGMPTSSTTSLYKVKISLPKVANKDIELWKENGCPSSQMIKLMRDVVLGLSHLHEIGIIHRDLKPQNVLINTHKCLSAKLSDMGISKRLPKQMTSLGHNATGRGSSGWQAPEQLLHGRQTRAVDLFSLGCLLFFCITRGQHPFGGYFERDANILNNRVDLFLVEHIPEAVHLFSNLLNADPELRPRAVEVLKHPLFWDSETRLSFLRDTSDRIELEDRESRSELLKAIENVGPIAFGGKWGDKLSAAFITDMGRYRKYRFESTRDLLRVVRNKLNHYHELPKELKEILGSVPEGFDDYFALRFPKLVIEVYKVVYRHCREEDSFRKYFKSDMS